MWVSHTEVTSPRKYWLTHYMSWHFDLVRNVISVKLITPGVYKFKLFYISILSVMKQIFWFLFWSILRILLGQIY